MTTKQAKKQKSKKRPFQETPQLSAAEKRRQNPVRKAFTVVICVIVALGLMLPVAGIGVVSSCSPTQEELTRQQP